MYVWESVCVYIHESCVNWFLITKGSNEMKFRNYKKV